MTTTTTKRESTEDRCQAIAAAARALIVEKGFEGLRTRDIAERVGINIATLHYHVPTKDALIELVAESAMADFVAQSRRANSNSALSPAQRLHLEFEEFLETVRNRQELLAVMSEFDQRSRRDPKVKGLLDQMRGRWLGHLVNILAQGVRDGSFRRDLDPPAGGAMIVAALMGTTRVPGVSVGLIASIAAEIERSFRHPNSSNDL